MPSQELVDAVNSGDPALIRQSLPELAEEEQGPYLQESILRATYESRPAVVRALVEVNASPATADALGNTPLHWAARQANEETFRTLIECGAESELDTRNQESAVPLHLAAQHNAGPILQLMIQKRADLYTRLQDQRTALHLAADHGASVAAAVLLQGRPEQPKRGGYRGAAVATEEQQEPPPGLGLLELESDRGETAMMRAAVRGHAGVIQLLLKCGAGFETRNWWGQTPLQLACHGGHLGAAQILINAEADVSTVAQDGSSPLHTAADRGHSQVVELLLTRDAAVDAKAVRGRTPLHVAAERGCLEAVDALLTHGATVDPRSDEDRTPLSYASARGHIEVAKRLCEGHADMQAIDNTKRTPLHLAAAAGRLEVADLLVEKRVLLELQDASGRTPLALAIDSKQDAVVRMLLKQGAKMPEKVNPDADMESLQKAVEKEVLEAQLKEAEDAQGAKQVKEAEQEFEIARVKMLKLATLTSGAQAAPDVRKTEVELMDMTALYQAREAACATLKSQIAEAVEANKEVKREIREQDDVIENLNSEIKGIKSKKTKAMDELMALKKSVQEARDRVKKKQAEEEKRSRVKEIEEMREAAKAMEAELAAAKEEDVRLQEQLAQVKEQLAKWHEEKEKAARLHAQAHALLNRGGEGLKGA